MMRHVSSLFRRIYYGLEVFDALGERVSPHLKLFMMEKNLALLGLLCKAAVE